LIWLEAAGVLRSKRVGNLVRYRADPACPIYEELCAILRKTAEGIGKSREIRQYQGE
jgi:hypothetical protein